MQSGTVIFRSPDSLPRAYQLGLIVALSVLTSVSLLFFNSVLVLAIVAAIAFMWWVVQSPFRSVCAFIIINDVLTIRPRQETSGLEAPTALDLLLGIALMAIIAYWTIRVRLYENQPLSESRGHLLIVIFFVWSILVTLGALLFFDISANAAVREILNLIPLLILPLLYGRFIKSGSRDEKGIVILVVISAVIVSIWNIHLFRSNVARAYYLFQTGRAASDLALVCLLILAMLSYLMVKHKWWQNLGATALLGLGIVALVISFTRTLYVGVLVAGVIVLWAGQPAERRRGIVGMLKVSALGVLALIPFYLSSRVLRLLLSNYAYRFITTQHVSTDRSFLNRLMEWTGEWQRIVESPIVGNGFGAMFRFFNMLQYQHDWMGFSHNSYLYILFKTGFVGGLLFFTANGVFVLKGIKLLRIKTLDATSRILLRTAVLSMVLQLFGAFTGPTFCSKTPMLWLGLVWGYLLSLEKRVESSIPALDR